MKFLAALLVLLAVLSTSLAGAAEGPMAQLKSYVDQTIAVLSDPELKGDQSAEARRRQIWQIITPAFAERVMVSKVLGQKQWKKLTPEQQEEIVYLFGELLKRSYIGKLESYSDQKIVYKKEWPDGDDYVVETIIQSRAERIPINYRLINIDGNWKIYDVDISGSSLVATNRSVFGATIRKDGYPTLVNQLKAKLAEEEALEKAGQ